MKTKVKSEKGIMAIYVTVTLVTFIIILLAIFSGAVAVRKNQIKTLIKIKEVYEKALRLKSLENTIEYQEIKEKYEEINHYHYRCYSSSRHLGGNWL